MADPLTVKCPKCDASAGDSCRQDWPSRFGKVVRIVKPHKARVKAAEKVISDWYQDSDGEWVCQTCHSKIWQHNENCPVPNPLKKERNDG